MENNNLPRKAVVRFSEEIEALLADNSIDFEKVFRDSGVNVNVSRGDITTAPTSTQTKDIGLILAGSAAAIAASTLVLREFLNMLGRRPVILKRRRFTRALGADGKPVFDSSGAPVFEWEESESAILPNQPLPEEQSLTLESPIIDLSFSVKSGE